MEDYYREILDEIDGLMRDNKLQQAFSVLEKELSMPYIPPEAEEKMQQRPSWPRRPLFPSGISDPVTGKSMTG